MKIKFKAVETAKTKSIEVSYGNEIISFPISALAIKVSKKILNKDELYHYTELYLNKRGKAEKIFILYKRAYDMINDILFSSYKDIQLMMYNILDELDVDDIIKFVYDEKLNATSMMKTKFDESKESDRLLSKDQTYLVDEYKELMALVIISKVIFPVLAMSALINENLYTNNKDFSLMEMIYGHKVFKHRVVDRLYRFINKHLETMLCKKYLSNPEMETAIRIIANTRDISTTDIEMFIFSFLFIRRMGLSLLYKNPPNTQHIPSIAYTLIDGVVNRNSVVSDTIRMKTGVSGDEGRSIMESNASSTSIGVGSQYEYDMFLASNITNLEHILKRNINPSELKILRMVEKAFKCFMKEYDKTMFNKGSKHIVAYVMSSVIDSRSIDSISRQSMVNAMIVSYTYLYLIGEYELATIVSLVEDKENSTIIEMLELKNVTTANKKKLDDFWYPKTKRTKLGAVVSVVNPMVADVSDFLTGVMTGYYRPIDIPGLNNKQKMTKDIKNVYVEFLLKEMSDVR